MWVAMCFCEYAFPVENMLEMELYFVLHKPHQNRLYASRFSKFVFTSFYLKLFKSRHISLVRRKVYLL